MLNKVTSIFFIPGMLGKKKNKVYIVRTGKSFNLQAIDQVSRFIFSDDNDGVSKVGIRKIYCYSGV